MARRTIFSVFVLIIIIIIFISIAVLSLLNLRPGGIDGRLDPLDDDNSMLKHQLVDKTSFTKQMENKTGRRFPDAIIIGVKKGGTRALINMLKSHPDVLGPEREIDYFSGHYDKGLEWYFKSLPRPTSNRTVIIEKSPSYFVLDYVPMLIYRDQPKPTKIILTVRNPVDRAISDYAHRLLVNHQELQKFEKLVIDNRQIHANIDIDILSMGLYDVHFQKWLEWFNRSEILVLDGEQLIKDPAMILKMVEKFLKLKTFFKSEMFVENPHNTGFYCWKKDRNGQNAVASCLGKTKGLPHPDVRKSVARKLNQYYKLHMTKFCDLASVNFTWCNL